MKRGQLSLIVFVFSALGLLGAGSVSAEADALLSDEDKIEYRHAVFAVIGANFKPMGAMAEGKIDYDPELFARNAQRIAFVSNMALEGFKGGPHEGETEALDAIWENWDDYRQGMDTFQEQAEKLASQAQGGADWRQLKMQMIQVADACKSCHDDYRQE
jgi:cytochrome c556